MTAVFSLLIALAIGARLAAQGGISLYPDSYEFVLGAQRLNPLSGLGETMGTNGDAWSVPFHRVGLSVIGAPLASLSGITALSFAAGVAQAPVLFLLLRRFAHSTTAAFVTTVAVAASFSAVGWSLLAASEATALLLAFLTPLLLLLTMERSDWRFAAAAAVSFALLLATRAELVLMLPALFLLPWAVGKPSAFGKVSVTLAASVLAWLGGLVLLSLVLDENLRGIQPNVITMAEENLGGDGAISGAGISDFLSHEIPLLALATLGAALCLIDRDRRGVFAVVLIAFPLALYATRDDFRYYMYLIPGLALLGAVGLEKVLAVGRPPFGIPLSAALVASAVALAIAAWSIAQLSTSWHPEVAYEEETASLVAGVLERNGVANDAIVCAPRPEAHYLETGRPARHLIPERPGHCFEGVAAGGQVVVVQDANVPTVTANMLAAVAPGAPELIETVPSPSSLIVGGEHFLAIEPIRVYLVTVR
jgi:hypothetical protein